MNRTQLFSCPSKQCIATYLQAAKSQIDKTTQFIKDNKATLFWVFSASCGVGIIGQFINFSSINVIVSSTLTSVFLFIFRSRYPTKTTVPLKSPITTPIPAKTSISVDTAVVDKFMTIQRQDIVDKTTVTTFIERGGKISFLDDKGTYVLDKTRRYLVGCSSGYNRSQIAYRLLKDLKLQIVAPPIAGYYSMMNPKITDIDFVELSLDDNMIFKAAVGHLKVPQLGFSELIALSDQERKKLQKTFYQDFVNTLEFPVTIIGFNYTPEAMIARLVASGKDLKGVEIIYCTVDDEILRPKDPAIRRNSAGAYMAFYEKMRQMFVLPS